MGWGQNNTVQTLETELDMQTMYRQCTASVQKMKVQCTDSVKLVEIQCIQIMDRQYTDSIQAMYSQCTGSVWISMDKQCTESGHIHMCSDSA